MSEKVDLTTVISRLLRAENILIIFHKNPDGDALGAAGSLYWALKGVGKTVAVTCSDPVHERYAYMQLGMYTGQFKPAYIVAVDIAGQQLFGDKTAEYANQVDLCIDHHGSNSGYAREMLLDASAASTCEIIYELILAMGIPIDKRIAECLYTGVSTDTGCFRFPNTTARTHRVAARLVDLGADIAMLNELLFEARSKQRVAIEQLALSTLEYHYGEQCALICITREEIDAVGVDDADLEGVTSLPRSIEGVLVGVTLRQQVSGSYKISVRTKVGIDASSICGRLGGGGHHEASGCELVGSLENVKFAILTEVKKELVQDGFIAENA